MNTISIVGTIMAWQVPYVYISLKKMMRQNVIMRRGKAESLPVIIPNIYN